MAGPRRPGLDWSVAAEIEPPGVERGLLAMVGTALGDGNPPVTIARSWAERICPELVRVIVRGPMALL